MRMTGPLSLYVSDYFSAVFGAEKVTLSLGSSSILLLYSGPLSVHL